MYLVMSLERERELNIGMKLPLIWADDMVGCLPVFKTKKAALKMAGKKHQVIRIDEVK